MPRQIIFFLAAVLAILPIGAKAAERINVERDTRIVSDTGSLDIVAISAQSDQTWIVAEIIPDAKDGRFEGVRRDAATGIYTQIPGQLIAQVHEGTIKFVEPIVGIPAQQTWSYEWQLPAGIYQQYLVSDSGTADPYLAFYGNNMIVCRINNSLPTTAVNLFGSKFYPLYLIPAQWKAYIIPALSYFRDNSEMFQSRNAAKNTDRLWKLTADVNPIIAIQALRVLFQGSQMNGLRLSKLLTGATGLKQAIFTFEVMGLKPQQPLPLPYQTISSFAIQQVVIDTINEITQKAGSSTELEGLAWGIWAAEAAPTTRRGKDNTAKIARVELLESLLAGIQKKQNILHTHTEEDARLNTWLRAANIPQQP